MKLLVYIILLFLSACGTSPNDSITDCRIIGGEIIYDSSGNFAGCIEPTVKIGEHSIVEYKP